MTQVQPTGETQIIPSTVWSGPGCHGGCGVNLHVRDGELIKIEGAKESAYNYGTLCPRTLSMREVIYHQDRLQYPLLRAGKRGQGQWRRGSWDEAYAVIERNLKEIRDEAGAESVVFVQGTGRDVGGWLALLACNYGSPNWMQSLPGNSCYHPRLGAMKVTMGDYVQADLSQFLAGRYDDPDWKVPSCFVVWGQNPVSTCTDGLNGHWVVEAVKRGAKLVVIDPHYTWLASRAALWLQIRPGTDGALALGMLNVIINEELYDREFVAKWTHGFDKLKERVQEYPPSKVAEITWIPEEQIVEAARLVARSKPAAIHWGVPIDMAAEGLIVATAVSYLWSITGNVDNPGGMAVVRNAFDVVPYPMSQQAIEQLYGDAMPLSQREKRIGRDEFPMVREFHWRCHPDLTVDAMLTDKPYPLRGSWIAGTNFLMGATDPKRWYEAFNRLKFNVVMDLFMTPTALALADVVLPAATFPEREGVRAWWAPLSIQQKAITVGECKSDNEVAFELSRRLNPGFKYDRYEDLVRFFLEPSGISLEELREKGWIMPPEGSSTRPYHRHEKGLLRPDGQPGFNTPTGKIELYSTTYERWGYDPLPFYTEPAFSPLSTPELAEQYPLILTTGARTISFFHSEFRQIKSMRCRDPYPFVDINPKTAEGLGIRDGDWVWIENHLGRVKYKARFAAIHPRVVNAAHSWWFPEKGAEEGFGMWESNVNLLIPGNLYSKTGMGGSQQKSLLCRVYKADEGIEGIFEPPGGA